MSRPPHTPGPWKSHDNPTSNYGLEVVAEAAVKAKRVICRVGGPDRVGNARLIEAAPKMLAALELVRSIISDGAMTGFNWKDGDWAERLFASQAVTYEAVKEAGGDTNSARNAIAKATGELTGAGAERKS